MYCGGMENSVSTAECFQVDLVDSMFKKLPDMMEPRCYPCVIANRGLVYVFGGFQGKISLKSCEKYDIVLRKWTKIGEMTNCRSGFCTSVVDNKIYIAGDSKTIEVFDVATEAFQLLNVKLESSKNFITIFAPANNKLILLQKDKSIEANLDTDAVKILKSVPSGDWWSQFSPVTYKKTAFFSRYDENSLWRIDYDTGDVKKIIKF